MWEVGRIKHNNLVRRLQVASCNQLILDNGSVFTITTVLPHRDRNPPATLEILATTLVKETRLKTINQTHDQNVGRCRKCVGNIGINGEVLVRVV